MNLEKMYETQRVFRERVKYDGDDRFDKLILALFTELGELANEWRGFKIWSKDQEPRTKKKRSVRNVMVRTITIGIVIIPIQKNVIENANIVVMGSLLKIHCLKNMLMVYIS